MASKKLKRKKFTRTISGKVRIGQQAKRTKVRKCPKCSSTLQGVPHGKSKAKLARMSKTEKRPSAPFAGELCSKCRRKVIDQAILVSQNSKSKDSIDLGIKGMVEKALGKIR